MIQLFNADCLPAMREMPDKAYDLAIVDPPYGISAADMDMGDGYYGKGRKDRLSCGAGKLKTRALQIMKSKWDSQQPPPEYFPELRRVSENQIVFGGNYFPLPPSRGVICWDKMQPWPNFSAWEMAWTSFDTPAKLFRFNNAIAGKIHPTQKPVALYKWLLTNYAKAGQTILDTHFGSLSIGIACHDLGFDLDAWEIDADYYRAGKERLERHQRQAQLFVEDKPYPLPQEVLSL